MTGSFQSECASSGGTSETDYTYYPERNAVKTVYSFRKRYEQVSEIQYITELFWGADLMLPVNEVITYKQTGKTYSFEFSYRNNILRKAEVTASEKGKCVKESELVYWFK
ncbi:MAG: hypothetical protein PHN88_03620 [Ignavibacteria bacterium]|nr:hypothetical protein [Ignavibacteria bacterium]